MTLMTKLMIGALAALGAVEIGVGDAEARGGGSNFMNSPGYQRRLQESRGYVTNQSGSLFARPAPPQPVERGFGGDVRPRAVARSLPPPAVGR